MIAASSFEDGEERARAISAGVTRGSALWVRSSFQEVGVAIHVKI